MLRRLALVALASLIFAAPVSAFSKEAGMQTMDDGVPIAFTRYTPDGAAPAGGWPGVLVLHGLAGDRASVEGISTFFTRAGYAVLAYDARGHGVSGGDIGLAGPREVADLRAIRRDFAARPDVSDTRVGAWGISYGGGQIWNGIAAGVPFAAVEVVETWTDLYSAMWMQDVARSGIVAGFVQSIKARSTLVQRLGDDAIQSRNLGEVRTLLRPRSVVPRAGGLRSIRTPVYLFQGRVDFAFDLRQATQAYAGLGGPKKLYAGNFGHPPSTFPGTDHAYVLAQGRAWFDRFLKGTANGVEKQPVVIAKQGSATGRVAFAGLPRTRFAPELRLTGTTTISGTSVVTRTARPLPQAVETWGMGLARVTVTSLSSYPRLVVTVMAGNKVVTHGALRPRIGVNVVKLADYCVYVPRGTRLRVTVGASSPPGQLAYLGFAGTGSATIGPVALKLSTLRTPVSR